MQDNEIQNIESEIEELAIQLTDMLNVALYFAGVKKEKLEEAVDAYVNAIDIVFKDDEDSEMGRDEIIKIIEYVKKNHPKLFE
ncbi:hypothetical protein [Sulfurospirillum sp. 1612]|uniref:hypothetical protein n=1 Tax=Sulfurospirillum sp. 1612 TaxID=3094835 RepID=UPI002F920133